MLGEKLKKLRELKGLLQRQVASELEMDTAYISKMESGEKPVSRNHIKKLASLYGIAEDELTTFWLADKIHHITSNEPMAEKALALVQENINIKNKRKKKSD